MKLVIYNIEPHIVVRIIIKCLIKREIDYWVDLGSGDGLFISKLGIIPKNGLLIDAVNNIKKMPSNFKFSQNLVEDWPKKVENFGYKFTLITAFELIEHLEKQNSLNLINKCFDLSDFLIISTPSGFLKQDIDTNPEILDNIYQIHKCGFFVEELEKLNFFVIVLKNYHFRFYDNKKFYDALIAFKNNKINDKNYYKRLKICLILNFVIFYLNPIIFLKTIKKFFKDILRLLKILKN